MRASLDYLAALQDDNLVAVPDGGQAMGDYDAGNAPIPDGVDHLIFRLGIQGGGGLVCAITTTPS